MNSTNITDRTIGQSYAERKEIIFEVIELDLVISWKMTQSDMQRVGLAL